MSAVLSASLGSCSPRLRCSLCVAATVDGITCALLPMIRMLMSSNHASGTGRGMLAVPVDFAIAA
eukprot:9340764-Pyramimonas_sp.AAC.1